MAGSGILAVLVCIVCITAAQQLLDRQIQLSLKARKLPYEICGESKDFDSKLLDGSKAHLGKYPWMVAIGYNLGTAGPYWLCAGSLVSDQFVLTAAHCLDPRVIRTSSGKILKVSMVRVGDLDMDGRVDDGASPVNMEVEKIIFHPEFDEEKKINDIGLIKLKKKIQFNNVTKPICLPPPEFYQSSFVNCRAVVISWGITGQIRKESALTEYTVYIGDIKSCRQNMTSVRPKVVLDERVVCASSPGKDSCQGDSGGPLMMYSRYKNKARMFLLGVVAYGWKCSVTGYPAVYMRVSQYMDWIIDNIEL